MARQIKLTEIDDFFEDLVVNLVQATTLEWTTRVKKATPVFSLDNYPDLDSIPDFFTLPNGQVVPFKKALLEHGAGGSLREAWQTKIRKFQGEVTNNLNTVRSTIEARLATELASSPVIPVIFNNMAFDSTTEDTFVQCQTSFGSGSYLTMGGSANSTNSVVGLLLINIFTEEGIGPGSNYVIGKRLRDLYNNITVSNVIFDSPVGPEVLASSPEGKFQTQIRVTFEIYEEL
jgi:hypothetical protein